MIIKVWVKWIFHLIIFVVAVQYRHNIHIFLLHRLSIFICLLILIKSVLFTTFLYIFFINCVKLNYWQSINFEVVNVYIIFDNYVYYGYI